MNDQDKVKAENIYLGIPEAMILDDLMQPADTFSDEIYVKKGFPLEIKVFWGFVGFLFAIKMVIFLCFDLPLNRIIQKQRILIQNLEENNQRVDALTVHEALMKQYPSYEKFYYLDIACCYFSCDDHPDHLRKGLEILRNKRLSAREFLKLKHSVATPYKDLFEMCFSVYVNEQDKTKIYVFESQIDFEIDSAVDSESWNL